MELLYLGYALICTIVLIYFYAVPYIMDVIKENMRIMQEHIEILEHSIIKMRQNLYHTNEKYEELFNILMQKSANIDEIMRINENEMHDNTEKKIESFREQMNHLHIEEIKKQHAQEIKTQILDTLQQKLSQRLSNTEINRTKILEQIVVEYKKTAQ